MAELMTVKVEPDKNMMDELIEKFKNAGVWTIEGEEQSVDLVNQPPHYKAHEMECIDELEVVLGGLGTYYFCLGNVWKYRYRADHKGNSEQDNAKSDWYMKKAKELKERYDLDVKVG